MGGWQLGTEDIVLDANARAAKTIVRRNLVSREKWLGTSVVIKCVHSDKLLYPLAQVEIVVDGVAYTLEVAV